MVFRKSAILLINAVAVALVPISYREVFAVIVVGQALVFLPSLSDFGIGRSFGQANGRFFLAPVTLAIADDLLAIDHRGHLHCGVGSEVVTAHNALGGG